MGRRFGLQTSLDFGLESDFSSDELDATCRLRGEGLGDERGEPLGEVPGEGNKPLALPVMLSRNGNAGIVDNLCARAATDNCGQSLLGEEPGSGGGFCGSGGLLDNASLAGGFCPGRAIPFGKEGRGFFGGKGFDISPAGCKSTVLAAEVISSVVFALSPMASGCLVSLTLRGYCGEVLVAMPLLLRGTGGEVLPTVLIILRGVGGEFLLTILFILRGVGGEFLLAVLLIFWVTSGEDAPVITPDLWGDDDVDSVAVPSLFWGGDGAILSTLKI